jgi:2'-5' RNA ligase
MEQEDLHMTFLFLGEQLSGNVLSAQSLLHWHSQLCNAFTDTFTCHDGNNAVQLRLDQLTLFPPQKCNLAVAVFEAPELMHRLQSEFEKISAEAGLALSGSLRRCADKTDNGSPVPWVPHVTLGKFGAKSSNVGRLGHKCISDCKQSPELASLQIFQPSGVELCGRVPKQAWIDWRASMCLSANDE